MTNWYNPTRNDHATAVDTMGRRLKARPALPETETHPDVEEGPGKHNDHMGDRDLREHTDATFGCLFPRLIRSLAATWTCVTAAHDCATLWHTAKK